MYKLLLLQGLWCILFYNRMETTSPHHPILQALILADDIYTDRETGKKVIAGTFHGLWSSAFPAQFGRQTKAFVSFTNCRGTVRVQLRWVDLQDDAVLMQSPIIQLDTDNDPLMTYELVMEVPGFPMPHEGHFAFELYCNDQRLGALRVAVRQTRIEDKAKDEPQGEPHDD